jgi:predicted urease superfamily metal-dependent hydrolase
MATNSSKDLRHYAGAAGIFALVIALLLFLSFYQIPKDNKDIFVSIVGMIVGSLSVVIYAIIGRNPDEVNALKSKNESLQSLADQMEKRNDQLEKMIIDMQSDIIDKLTILGASAFDTVYNKNKQCSCGNNSCTCKGA